MRELYMKWEKSRLKQWDAPFFPMRKIKVGNDCYVCEQGCGKKAL